MGYKITFLGDVCIDGSNAIHFPRPRPWDDSDFVIADLEGPILSHQERKTVRKNTPFPIYNSPDIVQTLKEMKVDAVVLANNHQFDCENSIRLTKQYLDDAQILYTGAGTNIKEASKPISYRINDQQIYIFSFGWKPIGCQYASNSKEGVNPLIPSYMIENSRVYRTNYPESIIVYYCHWNFEFELYPQPAHRQLAHDLIDCGVDIIVGCHPHVAEGAELIKGKPVVYSLGNWLNPPRFIGGKRLIYPEITYKQLAFTVLFQHHRIKDVRYMWYIYDHNKCELDFIKEEDRKGELLEELTPYKGMNHKEYKKWFKQYRKRSVFLPIFYNYNDKRINLLKTFWVLVRQAFIIALVRLNFKKL